MTLDEFKNRLIEEGIASVNKNEKRPERIRGCLGGFELCKLLNTPDDFTRLIGERQDEEHKLVALGVDAKEYWEYRCATTQIEFVFEHMKVAWQFNGLHLFPSLSARATLHYAEIVGIKEAPGAEFGLGAYEDV